MAKRKKPHRLNGSPAKPQAIAIAMATCPFCELAVPQHYGTFVDHMRNCEMHPAVAKYHKLVRALNDLLAAETEEELLGKVAAIRMQVKLPQAPTAKHGTIHLNAEPVEGGRDGQAQDAPAEEEGEE